MSLRAVETSSAIALLVALLAGGATQKGVASDALVQLACLPLIAAILVNLQALSRACPRMALGLTIGVVLIPVLQLAPLLPALWTRLPGRQIVTEIYAASGIQPEWRALTLSPWATSRVAFALIPPVSIFLGVTLTGAAARWRLWSIILGIAFLSCFLSLAQAVGGTESPLRFYEITNRIQGVGFFANANHEAALLYSSVPLAAYLFSRTAIGYGGAVALFAVNMTLAVGLVLTGSRSALMLGAIAWTLSYISFYRRLPGRPQAVESKTRLWLGLGIAGVLMAEAFDIQTILNRFRGVEVLSDSRWIIDQLSLKAAYEFFPFGSGLGTFEHVFPLFQTPKTIIAGVVNHAHNDPLELVVETGLAGVLGILAGLTLYWREIRRASRRENAQDNDEPIALLIVITLLGIHSLWDYPLRTSALGMVFAACAGALVAGGGKWKTTGTASDTSVASPGRIPW